MAEDTHWTGYQIDPHTGLLLPEPLAKSRAELSERAERQARGKFFSQMGRAERYNQMGAQEKPPDEPSFRYLRDAYWESQIDQLCVMHRQAQVRSVARRITHDSDHRIGWTVRHRDHSSPRFKETPDIRRRCQEMAEIIDRPWREIHPGGFADFAVTSVEDELVLDRKAMIVFKDRQGLPARYYAIDGATIKPIVRVLYEWVEEHRGEHTQWGPDLWDVAAEALSYQVGFDLTKAAWVQEIDGVITAAWAADEISLDQVYPSVEINRLAYGRGSPFQRSLTLTDLWISLIDYNRGLFSISYPENLLLLFGDYSPAGLEAFTRQLTSQVGTRNWSRLGVITADPEFKAELMKLRDTPKDMVWPSLARIIIAMKTACYGMHPSEINFASDRADRPVLSERNQTAELLYAKEEGFDGLLHHLSDWINRTLVWPRYPDLEMVWVNLHREKEEDRIQLATQRVASYWTINEARQQENLPRIDEPWADMPLPLALQQHKEAAQTVPGATADDLSPTAPTGGAPYQPPERTPAESATPAPSRSGATSLRRSAVRVWARQPQVLAATTPEGWWRVQVGGRRYLIEPTPYGTRFHGPNGALVFATDQRARNVDEAVAWLQDYLEEARDGESD
ncbi:MAG: hypothetical protein K6V97_03955 [Actinomycetia bacterium]|nr:hypothetical protein [Actinomycetes bacterium]